MKNSIARTVLFNYLALTIVCMGFVQVSHAEVIGTEQLISSEAREAAMTRIESIVMRDDVRQQLSNLGVSQEVVLARVDRMTDSELASFESSLSQGIVGGDALAVIGAVFLVLLILELVGVTDIFKSI
ncbi:MAG: PA2779 family protein [Gammaproteobacteria bacterium]|jgi:hypothetical protein|nr:PA2779 family protein [Gammaproteobacteria bacterium]